MGCCVDACSILPASRYEAAFFEERLTEEIWQIYGGVSGLFDLGPPGTALQSNLLDIWRKHFVRKSILLLNYSVQC